MVDWPKEAIQYDIEALKRNVKKCYDNIKTFEEAIANEYKTIRELKYMISVLEEKVDRQK